MPELNQFRGVDGVGAVDKLADDELQFSSNIDFSIEDGVATRRHGSLGMIVGTSRPTTQEVDHIFRHYNVPGAFGGAPWYTMSTGTCFRLRESAGTATVDGTLFTDGVTDENGLTAFSSFRGDVFIASQNRAIRDDGTNSTDWIKQAPGAAVTATVATLTPLTVVSTYTTVEGTGTAAAQVGTATVTADSSSLRLELKQANLGPGGTTTDLNTNAGNTIGDFGVHHLDLSFSEPKNVSRISIDYSIGDATYANYLHTELNVKQSDDAQASIDTLLDAALNKDASQNIHATVEDRTDAKALARQRHRPPRSRVSAAKDSFNTWSIPVTELEIVGKAPEEGLTNIGSCRLVIECIASCVVTVRNWVIQGAENYALNDSAVGYAHWETFVTVGTIAGREVILSESAPSPPSTRTKITNGRFTAVSTNTVTGTVHGLTHRVLYAQGGFLADAYAVSTLSGVTATTTYTHSLSDVQALLDGNRMLRDIRSTIPQTVRAISSPWNDRLFIAWNNRLGWSLPGKPDTFPRTSETEVSHDADHVNAVVTAGNVLVVVNRESIFELRGSVFESPNQDWILERMQTRGGSAAARATILTPFGILLVREDGWFLYEPGIGRETPITWMMEKFGDIFRGAGTQDPAQQKGQRVGAGLSFPGLSHCAAAWKNDKLYFAYPDGVQTRPNVLLVADFKRQKIWRTSYPWSIRSMFADRDHNVLRVGTTQGAFMNLEESMIDDLEAGGQQNVVWNAGSRRWTVANDTVVENVFIEHQGANSDEVLAVYDGTTTVTAGTLTNSDRNWQELALSGTFARSLEFKIFGTGTNGNPPFGIFNINWDALVEPKRRTYWRTEHELAGHDGDKIWDVGFTDIEITGTGHVFGTFFVDNVVVTTQTMSGPHTGRVIEEVTFPDETIGEVGYAVYRGTSAVEFKHWATKYSARAEPPKLNNFRTQPESLEENILDAVDFDVNPNGTLTSTVLVDSVSVGTFTSVASRRQSFTHSLPVETYGRTVETLHQGAAFKHYKTWYHKRLEPDRWTAFNSDRVSEGNRHLKLMRSEIDPLGNTVLAKPTLDGTVVTTFTLTGTERQSFANHFPKDTVGKTIYTQYSASSGKFKHYFTDYEGDFEPEEVTFAQTDEWKNNYDGDKIFDVHTVDLEVTGTGTVTATAFVDNANVLTHTIIGPTSGRVIAESSFPINTIGEIAFTCLSGPLFKLWDIRYAARNEPHKMTSFKTDEKSVEERILDALDLDVNPNGTLTSIVKVDNVAVGTFTSVGTVRQSFTHTIAPETYGRTAWVEFTGASFKLYRHWFHTRPEPDRWTTFNSPRVSGDNRHFKLFHADLDCLGNNVTAIPTIDGTAVTTFTFSSAGRQQFSEEFAADVFGKTVYTVYSAAPNTFKHYDTGYDGLPEPEVIQSWQTDEFDNEWPAEKIWDVHCLDLDVIGTGTMLGTVFVDNVAVMTHTVSGPTTGRVLSKLSFPIETLGYHAYSLLHTFVVSGTTTTTNSVDMKFWRETFHARNEPPQVNDFKTEVEATEEAIFDAVDFDLAPNGTVTSTVFIDGVAVSTFSSVGSKRLSFTNSLPSETYGRTAYTVHNGASFKHYRTWYHRRIDPDRWTGFTTPRESADERWFRNFNCDIDCLGNTVLATAVLDGTAHSTFTMTAGERQSFTRAFPSDSMGRTVYVVYNASTGRFKHHQTWFDATQEPDRVDRVQWGPQVFDSEQYVRTWVAELNPLGQTVTGVLSADGVAISTQTFTGSIRTTYDLGVDLDGSNDLHVGTSFAITYTAAGDFKHYSSKLETQPKPFGKVSWTIPYVKIGGASALDLASAYSLDLEPVTGTATVTSIWDVDGAALQTDTLTFTAREFQDKIRFAPGMRGYNWRQRLIASAPVHVWRSRLKLHPVGIKGGVARDVKGRPS